MSNEPTGEYKLSDDEKRQYCTVTDQRLWDRMSNDKPKWYDEWNIEIGSANSYGLCDIKISIPHSAAEEKIFRLCCSHNSEVRKLVMLLDCALYELTERDKQ